VVERASDSGARTLGRAVVFGLGAATPLAALLWALWGK